MFRNVDIGTPTSNLLLEEIGKHNSICWYPSAGSDLRPLLYLSRPFYDKHEELAGETAPLPDLFILTDYQMDHYEDYSHQSYFWRNSFDKIKDKTLKKGDILFSDHNTTFTTDKAVYFCIDDIDVNKELICFDIPPYYGQGCLMTINVDSHDSPTKKLGQWKTAVIYLYAENTAFAKNILLQNGVNIDYIVRVRYGGGFGGSNGTFGHWLFYLADQLKVKYYISGCYNDIMVSEDKDALEYIKGGRDITFEKAAVTEIYQRNWYYNEPVRWYKI